MLIGIYKRTVKNKDLCAFDSIYDLASCLEPATKNAELPPLDLRFNFKRFDKLSSDNIKNIISKPVLSFRFGWFQLYSGHDINRYQDIKSKLTTAGLNFKASEYTATTRLSIQGLANQGIGAPGIGNSVNKGPAVTPYGLQAKVLSNKAMDRYYIEVRKKDAEKAREALRLV